MLQMQEIYVIGHTNPDTDSIVSAIAMADFLNRFNTTDEYVPARAGELNSETEFVMERFSVETPMFIKSINGHKVFLVDHNERSQYYNGITVDDIIGIVDHHKINFQNSHPIESHLRPWGSTSSIVYDLYDKYGISLPDRLKPILLCGILSDTVILRSPTTTKYDREIVEILSKELGIDYQQLGMEMFTAKAQLDDKTPEQILHNDFKVFEMGEHMLGIGQVETPDLTLLKTRVPDLLSIMKELKQENNYFALVLMLTDIINEGSQLLVVSDDIKLFGDIFETTIQDNISAFIPGMLSRKKQVVPQLTQALAE